MKENNLLASAALFSELYNSEHYTNISDIIAEFIKGAIVYENKYSFISTELKDLLQKIYGFIIPESVIRTTLNNKFRDTVQREGGYYNFDNSVTLGFETIKKEYETITENQEKIIEELYLYISKKENKELLDKEKIIIFENFNHFLLDNGYSDKYSNHISAFVITNENNKEFTQTLNSIREGLILYQGIRYTSNLNELGVWNTELTFYLSTEHLFNSLGYNGLLFKEIFDDLLGLVNEINLTARTKFGKRIIHLKYFTETKAEVDSFFHMAEQIKRGYLKLDPTRSAMKKIVDECKTPSDVKIMRNRFETELTALGIYHQEFNQDINSIKRYNIEDLTIIEELRKQSIEKNKYFDEDSCQSFLNTFTKINYYRKGNSKNTFENVGHIFITENSFAKHIAHNNAVRFEDGDISFAKDIDFAITKLWFKLKKGFSNKSSLPKSFDVVNKAKLILSSHLISSVSQKYNQLSKEVKEGKLSSEQAAEMAFTLRDKPNKPEDVSLTNVDSFFNFLNDDSFFENLRREQARKEQEVDEIRRERDELREQTRKAQIAFAEKQLTMNLKNYDSGKKKYVDNKWRELKRVNNIDLARLISVFLLNFALASAAVSLPVVADFKNWLIQFNFIQIAFLVLYAFTITIEIVFRSYIFNKEKLKRGWVWFCTLVIPSQMKKYRSDNKYFFETEYLSLYPKPVLEVLEEYSF